MANFATDHPFLEDIYLRSFKTAEGESDHLGNMAKTMVTFEGNRQLRPACIRACYLMSSGKESGLFMNHRSSQNPAYCQSIEDPSKYYETGFSLNLLCVVEGKGNYLYNRLQQTSSMLGN